MFSSFSSYSSYLLGSSQSPSSNPSSSPSADSQPTPAQESDFTFVEAVQPDTTQEAIENAIVVRDRDCCRNNLAELLGSAEKGDFFELEEDLQTKFIALLDVNTRFSEFAIDFICEHCEEYVLIEKFLKLLDKAGRSLMSMLLQTETKYAEHAKNITDTATYGYATWSGVSGLISGASKYVGQGISASGYDITNSGVYKQNIEKIIKAAAKANSVFLALHLVGNIVPILQVHPWLHQEHEHKANLNAIFEKIKGVLEIKTNDLLESAEELKEQLSRLNEVLEHKYDLAPTLAEAKTQLDHIKKYTQTLENLVTMITVFTKISKDKTILADGDVLEELEDAELTELLSQPLLSEIEKQQMKDMDDKCDKAIVVMKNFLNDVKEYAADLQRSDSDAADNSAFQPS